MEFFLLKLNRTTPPPPPPTTTAEPKTTTYIFKFKPSGALTDEPTTTEEIDTTEPTSTTTTTAAPTTTKIPQKTSSSTTTTTESPAITEPSQDETTTMSPTEESTEAGTETTETSDTEATTEPMTTEMPAATTTKATPKRRRRRQNTVNTTTIIVGFAQPNDYDLTLHYDSNDPLNYYNYATPGQFQPKERPATNGHLTVNPAHVAAAVAGADFLPAQHRQETVLPDIDDNIVNDKFHITPFESIQVPYRMYNTILRYAYIDSIKSSLVELPLDSNNYNLLILVPDVDNHLDAVLSAMRNDYSVNLRQLQRRLRPHWIKTIVPKFQQKGNIVLTNDLMKVSEYFN